MVDKAQTSGASVEEAAFEVSPEAGHKGRNDETHDQDKIHIPPVLPPHDLALAQVADIGNTGPTARLDEHPPDMREEEALVRVVRVELRVRVAVVRAVAARPPLDGPLHGAATGGRKEVLERLRRVVRAVRPEPVVPSRDAWKEKGLSPV